MRGKRRKRVGPSVSGQRHRPRVGAGQCGARGSEHRPEPPEPPVLGPAGGAASAGLRAWTGRLLAALNEIRGERLGPSEHRMLATAGMAKKAQEALLVPKGEGWAGQGPPESSALRGHLGSPKLGAQPGPAVLSNNAIQPNKTKPCPRSHFPLYTKEEDCSRPAKKRRGQDPGNVHP